MTDFLNMCLMIMIPVTLGLSIILYLTRRNPLPLTFSLALAYGLGTGILTQWILTLGFLKIHYSASTINIPLILFTVYFIYLLFRGKQCNECPHHHKQRQSLPTQKIDPISVIFIVYIALLLSYIFWRSLNIPINEWDAFSTMAFKAKIFYYDQSLIHLSDTPKFTYPLHIDFLLMWSAFCLGRWDDQISKLVFPLSSLSFLIIQYHFLRNYTKQRWALFGLVLLLSSNFYLFHSTISYRDTTILYYNCTTIILLLLWHIKKENSLLFLAGLFSGFTTFVKLEGTGYCLIHILLFGYLLWDIKIFPFRKNLITATKFLIPACTLGLFYHIFKLLFFVSKLKEGTKTHQEFNFHELQIALSGETWIKFTIVIKRFFENFFLTGNWNILWTVLIFSLLCLRKDKYQFEIKALLITIAMFFAIYIPAYTLTQHFVWIAYKEDVLSRTILHFFPLVTILIILLNFPKENGDV